MAVPEPAKAGRGRPALSEPRNHLAATRLTQAEYDGLLSLLPSPKASISDLVRELLSEAVLYRMARRRISDRSR